MKGTVFDIQRFCVNDGPGIRTTVFLKGCMLRCLWCHNPESWSPSPELMLYSKRCIGCGDCADACSKGNHSFNDGAHIIDRRGCDLCGACVDECIGALEICGKQMSVEEILAKVERDVSFYRNTGGGITVSGGEPLYQHEFARELLRQVKERGLHTCIETSGYIDEKTLLSVLQYVDLCLFDLKESDPERHKLYTGVDNGLILSNLRTLGRMGKPVVLRCPIIPGYNDRAEHFAFIGALADEIPSVVAVDVEPYHPMGKDKCEALGRSFDFDLLTFPSDECVNEWIKAISVGTAKPVRRG